MLAYALSKHQTPSKLVILYSRGHNSFDFYPILINKVSKSKSVFRLFCFHGLETVNWHALWRATSPHAKRLLGLIPVGFQNKRQILATSICFNKFYIKRSPLRHHFEKGRVKTYFGKEKHETSIQLLDPNFVFTCIPIALCILGGVGEFPSPPQKIAKGS